MMGLCLWLCGMRFSGWWLVAGGWFRVLKGSHLGEESPKS